MNQRRGIPLLLIFLLLSLLYQNSREVLRDEGPPAFFLDKNAGVWLGLGAGFPRPGVHQFSDGTTLSTVIKMTGMQVGEKAQHDRALDAPLQTGSCLELVLAGNQVVGIMEQWLPAGQRIALGIPLHPDRMVEDDWQFLPGIGVKRAQAIEEDRQINGDYGSLQALRRVSGIGPKRLSSWESFFSDQ